MKTINIAIVVPQKLNTEMKAMLNVENPAAEDQKKENREAEKLEKGLLEKNLQCKISIIKYCGGMDIAGEIKSSGADVLVTIDLAGFDVCTLTDNISYNLLNCKQIHIISQENAANEKYLYKDLSIAMFFYCTNETLRKEYERKYPNIPVLRSFPEGVAARECFFRAVSEVIEECKIN